MPRGQRFVAEHCLLHCWAAACATRQRTVRHGCLLLCCATTLLRHGLPQLFFHAGAQRVPACGDSRPSARHRRRRARPRPGGDLWFNGPRRRCEPCPPSHACAASPTSPTALRTYTPMTHSLYNASIPVFRQMLGSVKDILTKTEAHATARKIEPEALLQARLFPDMFPLARQVLIACDFAKGVAARLAGVEAPTLPDAQRPGFAELHERIGQVLAFVEGLPAASFPAAATRQITLQPGTPREKQFVGEHYLLHYGLPQFFFHVNATYAIARHNGVELGKSDYMGRY